MRMIIVRSASAERTVTGMAKYNPDEFFNRKPLTNADRIRGMGDEELATYLSCLFTAQYHIGANPHFWLDWLQEATE